MSTYLELSVVVETNEDTDGKALAEHLLEQISVETQATRATVVVDACITLQSSPERTRLLTDAKDGPHG